MPEGTIVTDPVAPVEPKTAPEWQASLAERFGMDVSGFSDETNALAAIRMSAENSARAALQTTPAAEPVEPATPVEITAESLGLDEDTDPQILKAFQSMSAAQGKQIADLQAELSKRETSSSSINGSANAKIANEMIDKLASPKYGVGSNRTVAQTLAVNRVFELAELIYKGSGSSVQGASVQNIVSSAILMDAGAAPSMSAVQGNPPPEPSNVGGLAGEKKLYGRPPLTKRGDDPNDPMGLKTDPAFREGVRRILER